MFTFAVIGLKSIYKNKNAGAELYLYVVFNGFFCPQGERGKPGPHGPVGEPGEKVRART